LKNFKLTGISGGFLFVVYLTDTPQVGVLDIKGEIEPAIRTEVLKAELILLKDVIAWAKNTKVLTIHRVKLKSEPMEDIPHIDQILFGGKGISFSHFDILAGFHDILKEKDFSLRYLMYYRFLEVVKRKKNLSSVDDLFRALELPVKFVSDTRNSKKEVSTITSMRNKIHATNLSYIFPKKELVQSHDEINAACRALIEKLAPDRSFHFPQRLRVRRKALAITS
jgi:hypothetical protein